MNTEQTQILQMLADGKITVDEATKLIDAAAAGQSSTFTTVQESAEERKPTFVEEQKPTQRSSTGRWTNWANNLDGMLSRGANLEGAFFAANNIESANFENAEAESAKFVASNLENVTFEGANLKGAKILCANLEGANFRNANLEGVTIFAANFENANFEGADLCDQSYICTNMENFDGAAEGPLHKSSKSVQHA